MLVKVGRLFGRRTPTNTSEVWHEYRYFCEDFAPCRCRLLFSVPCWKVKNPPESNTAPDKTSPLLSKPLPTREPLTPEEAEEFKAKWRARFGREPQKRDLESAVSMHAMDEHIKWLLGPGRSLKKPVTELPEGSDDKTKP